MSSRTPPAEIQRALREEVAYGCPCDGCRQPFLTWHHFDPPWREKQHHDLAGMIALCGPHHHFADAEGFSKQELRALKARDYSLDSVKADFPWAKRSVLVRLGGCYSGGRSALVRVSNDPLISLTLGPKGLLLLSFVLRAPDGNVIAEMHENGIQAIPAGLHDLQCNSSATRIKVWFGKHDIGLELAFSRITTDELYTLLQDDQAKAHCRVSKTGSTFETVDEMMDRVKSLWPAELTPDYEQRVRDMSWWLKETPEHLREKFANDGPATVRTFLWTSQHCVDEDGKLTLIDFRNMHIFAKEKEIRVRNGVVAGNLSLFHCSSFGNSRMFDL